MMMGKRILLVLLSPVLLLLLTGEPCVGQAPVWAWAKSAKPIYGSDYASCIGTDAAGNVYAAGLGGPGVQFDNLNPFPEGMFLVKYTPGGNLAWAKNFNCNPASLYTDQAGNSFVTGRFYDTVSFGNITLVAEGYFDLFTAKFNSDGDVVWAKRAGGPNILYMPMTGEIEDESFTITADASGNCYISAAVLTSDTAAATFDSISVYTDTPTLIRRTVAVLAKYDAAGNIQWVRKINGNGARGAPASLAVTNQGDCYISGTFSGSFTIGTTTLTSNGNSDIFYAKFNSQGNLVWAKNLGGPGYDSGDALVVNELGEVYLAGTFRGGFQAGNVTLTGGSGSEKVFLAKCDTDGEVLWATQTQGSGYAMLPRLAVDAAGNSYVTCRQTGTIIVGTDTLIANTSAFTPVVIKYNDSGSSEWAINMHGTGFDWINGIALTVGQTACYIYGAFEHDLHLGNISLQSGPQKSFFVAKLENLVTGTSSLIQETSWSVYPNPASRVLHLKLPATAQPAKAILTDVRGQEVYSVSFTSADKTLQLPTLPQGVYVISIFTEKEVLRKKIMIQ